MMMEGGGDSGDEIDLENIEFEYNLCNLTNHIKKQGFPIENTFVSYYSADFQALINCGPEPISKAITISLSDLEVNNDTKEFSIQLIFARGVKAELYDQNENSKIENNTDDLALQRNKERSIGFIIEKVTQWRKLYNGYYDDKNELKRMSLEQAANEVGVSKKSLDDYLS